MLGNADFAGDQLVAADQGMLGAVDETQPLTDQEGQRQQSEAERPFQPHVELVSEIPGPIGPGVAQKGMSSSSKCSAGGADCGCGARDGALLRDGGALRVGGADWP